ncbi:FtsX-like permease family protein [Lachnospiraceae bacterium MD308]|nr:FtsX-like permease family protein [Lachnospiraceae bacterium MD308]
MNMKKTIKVVKGYLFKNLKKTCAILSMLGIIICCYIVVNQSFYNIINVNIKTVKEEQGDWHFQYKYADKTEIEKIKNAPDISAVGCEWVLGETEDGLLLLNRDDKYMKMDSTFGNLINGKFPESEKEIALTQSYMKKHGYRIGEIVQFSYRKTNYEDGQELFADSKQFEIVGMIEDYAEAVEQSIGLVADSLVEAYPEMYAENLFVKFTEEKDIDAQIKRIISDLGLKANIVRNEKLLFAIEDNSVYSQMNRIINLIIWIASVLLIYNVLFFDYLNKKKDLGVLRSIGFKTKDLSQIIILEIIILFILCIPIGYLSGKFVNGILFDKILNTFLNINYEGKVSINGSLNAGILLQVIFLLGITIIPSIIKPLFDIRNIKPIDIMNQNGISTTIKYPAWIKVLDKLFRKKMSRYGLKNVVRNKKRTYLTVGAMFFSCTIICLMVFVNGVGISDASWVKMLVPGDIQISLDQESYENKKTISKETFKGIKEISGISKAVGYQTSRDVVAKTQKDKLNTQSTIYKEMSDEFLKNNTTIEDGKEYLRYSVTVYGRSHTSEGLGQNSAIIDTDMKEISGADVGDSIILENMADVNGKPIEILVSKVVSNEKFPVLSERGSGIGRIIVDEEFLKELEGEEGYDRIDIWAEDDETNIILQLEELEELRNTAEVISFQDKASMYLKAERNQMEIQSFFIFVLSAIGMINIFNTIFNNLLNRENEIIVLHSIGMDRKEIVKSITAEGCAYAVMSSVSVAVIQIMLIVINKIMGLQKISFDTITVFFAMDILLFVISYIFSKLSINYMWKKIYN